MAGKAAHGRFFDLPPAGAEEQFEILAQRGGARVERIVSRGQASPPGFWYDQDEDEWVIVLRGRARLALDGGAVFELAPGGWIDLPAHCRHRVDWTDPEEETVWLAFFWPAQEPL